MLKCITPGCSLESNDMSVWCDAHLQMKAEYGLFCDKAIAEIDRRLIDLKATIDCFGGLIDDHDRGATKAFASMRKWLLDEKDGRN